MDSVCSRAQLPYHDGGAVEAFFGHIAEFDATAEGIDAYKWRRADNHSQDCDEWMCTAPSEHFRCECFWTLDGVQAEVR